MPPLHLLLPTQPFPTIFTISVQLQLVSCHGKAFFCVQVHMAEGAGFQWDSLVTAQADCIVCMSSPVQGVAHCAISQKMFPTHQPFSSKAVRIR